MELLTKVIRFNKKHDIILELTYINRLSLQCFNALGPEQNGLDFVRCSLKKCIIVQAK